MSICADTPALQTEANRSISPTEFSCQRVVPEFLRTLAFARPVAMISSLTVRSHRALTCRGSVASTTRWKLRSGLSRR